MWSILGEKNKGSKFYVHKKQIIYFQGSGGWTEHFMTHYGDNFVIRKYNLFRIWKENEHFNPTSTRTNLPRPLVRKNKIKSGTGLLKFRLL